jgi:hypothetical protein
MPKSIAFSPVFNCFKKTEKGRGLWAKCPFLLPQPRSCLRALSWRPDAGHLLLPPRTRRRPGGPLSLPRPYPLSSLMRAPLSGSSARAAQTLARRRAPPRRRSTPPRAQPMPPRAPPRLPRPPPPTRASRGAPNRANRAPPALPATASRRRLRPPLVSPSTPEAPR